jgi:hypothetical protein
MQKLKKVLKSLIKSKSKKSEKSSEKLDKTAKKSPSKKVVSKAAVKPAKIKAKTSEKSAAKKPVLKATKKEVAPKKAAKNLAPLKVAKKNEAKLELKVELKANHKKLEKPEINAEKSTEKTKLVSAEKVPVKLKAKKTKEAEIDKTEIEEVPLEAKREYVDEEIYLTDADGRRYCRVKECDQVANVDAYCRYHYLLFWKKIQVRKKILTEGKLERYVEELTARYPDKYLEMLRKDLRSEKDFLNAIQELELDENSGENELEDEAQSYIEEVRGMSTEGGASSRDDDEF